jgi:uncharacterized membrane protein YhhN
VALELAILVTIGAVAMLLAAIRRGRSRAAFAAKAVASASFVAAGIAGWSPATPVASWLVAGLVLGAAGDLLLAREGLFDVGLLAFLVGHLAYVAAFRTALPLAAWPLPLLLLPVALGTTAAIWLWGFLGRRLPAVLAYVVVICFMTWGGLAVWAMGSLPWTAAAGAVLFTLSDLAVARQRFVTQAFLNRAVGLPLYYAGQLLFAATVAAA